MFWQKALTSGRRRELVAHVQASHQVSERRSYVVLGVDRSSVEYLSRWPDQVPPMLRIRDLVATRTRYDYFKAVFERAESAGIHMYAVF